VSLRRLSVLAILLSATAGMASAEWIKLLNGKNLEGWETIGDGVWTVMRDGTLVGQRNQKTAIHQAWLYTTKEFGEFDLELEYWVRLGGNSGVSIRDTSRARWAAGEEWDQKRTPSHIGYEIQISNGYRDAYPSGSVYLFDKAKPEAQFDNDWNRLEIESRYDMIRVRLNGQLVSQHPGDPDRPKVGPIGLQLHDRNSLMMFRNIRIREIRPRP
jgi:hypothetical protein